MKHALQIAMLIASMAAFTPAAKTAAYSISNPAFNVPANVREWFRNNFPGDGGSCVQCSIGMCGVDQNIPAASTLLWDTRYGPRERGGSWPGRVAKYCRARGIKIYNVTGKPTWDWMRWAVNTGRGAAIGVGTAHFQTLVGYDNASAKWLVCNNNSPQKIDRYSDKAFRRLHLASGQWCVILDAPPHPVAPVYREWWNTK